MTNKCDENAATAVLLIKQTDFQNFNEYKNYNIAFRYIYNFAI